MPLFRWEQEAAPKWNPSDFHCWCCFCLRNITQPFLLASSLIDCETWCAADITTAGERKKKNISIRNRREIGEKKGDFITNAMALADTSKPGSRAFCCAWTKEPCKRAEQSRSSASGLVAGHCTIRQAKRRQRRFVAFIMLKKNAPLWWICVRDCYQTSRKKENLTRRALCKLKLCFMRPEERL